MHLSFLHELFVLIESIINMDIGGWILAGKMSLRWLSQSENHELSFKLSVRLIYWTMAIAGANTGRK